MERGASSTPSAASSTIDLAPLFSNSQHWWYAIISGMCLDGSENIDIQRISNPSVSEHGKWPGLTIVLQFIRDIPWHLCEPKVFTVPQASGLSSKLTADHRYNFYGHFFLSRCGALCMLHLDAQCRLLGVHQWPYRVWPLPEPRSWANQAPQHWPILINIGT